MSEERTFEQRMYDALKTIARAYMTPDQIRRDSGSDNPLDYVEYLEMAYENIQNTAEQCIKGKRRPKP